MITRFITNVHTRFNPFSPRANSVRLFLAQIPPNARAAGAMTVVTELLPRQSTQPSLLHIRFRDGKEMNLDCEQMGIKHVVEEVDRHSRFLQKQEDLSES